MAIYLKYYPLQQSGTTVIAANHLDVYCIEEEDWSSASDCEEAGRGWLAQFKNYFVKSKYDNEKISDTDLLLISWIMASDGNWYNDDSNIQLYLKRDSSVIKDGLGMNWYTSSIDSSLTLYSLDDYNFEQKATLFADLKNGTIDDKLNLSPKISTYINEYKLTEKDLDKTDVGSSNTIITIQGQSGNTLLFSNALTQVIYFTKWPIFNTIIITDLEYDDWEGVSIRVQDLETDATIASPIYSLGTYTGGECSSADLPRYNAAYYSIEGSDTNRDGSTFIEYSGPTTTVTWPQNQFTSNYLSTSKYLDVCLQGQNIIQAGSPVFVPISKTSTIPNAFNIQRRLNFTVESWNQTRHTVLGDLICDSDLSIVRQDKEYFYPISNYRFARSWEVQSNLQSLYGAGYSDEPGDCTLRTFTLLDDDTEESAVHSYAESDTLSTLTTYIRQQVPTYNCDVRCALSNWATLTVQEFLEQSSELTLQLQASQWLIDLTPNGTHMTINVPTTAGTDARNYTCLLYPGTDVAYYDLVMAALETTGLIDPNTQSLDSIIATYEQSQVPLYGMHLVDDQSVWKDHHLTFDNPPYYKILNILFATLPDAVDIYDGLETLYSIKYPTHAAIANNYQIQWPTGQLIPADLLLNSNYLSPQDNVFAGTYRLKGCKPNLISPEFKKLNKTYTDITLVDGKFVPLQTINYTATYPPLHTNFNNTTLTKEYIPNLNGLWGNMLLCSTSTFNKEQITKKTFSGKEVKWLNGVTVMPQCLYVLGIGAGGGGSGSSAHCRPNGELIYLSDQANAGGGGGSGGYGLWRIDLSQYPNLTAITVSIVSKLEYAELVDTSGTPIATSPIVSINTAGKGGAGSQGAEYYNVVGFQTSYTKNGGNGDMLHLQITLQQDSISTVLDFWIPGGGGATGTCCGSAGGQRGTGGAGADSPFCGEVQIYNTQTISGGVTTNGYKRSHKFITTTPKGVKVLTTSAGLKGDDGVGKQQTSRKGNSGNIIGYSMGRQQQGKNTLGQVIEQYYTTGNTPLYKLSTINERSAQLDTLTNANSTIYHYLNSNITSHTHNYSSYDSDNKKASGGNGACSIFSPSTVGGFYSGPNAFYGGGGAGGGASITSNFTVANAYYGGNGGNAWWGIFC